MMLTLKKHHKCGERKAVNKLHVLKTHMYIYFQYSAFCILGDKINGTNSTM